VAWRQASPRWEREVAAVHSRTSRARRPLMQLGHMLTGPAALAGDGEGLPRPMSRPRSAPGRQRTLWPTG
jgi:hypothetical protein